MRRGAAQPTTRKVAKITALVVLFLFFFVISRLLLGGGFGPPPSSWTTTTGEGGGVQLLLLLDKKNEDGGRNGGGGHHDPDDARLSSHAGVAAATDDDDDDDDPVRPHIMRRSGELWSVWDRKTVLHGDEIQSECNWREFRPAGLGSHNKNGTRRGVAPPSFMCLYPPRRDVYVSGEIEKVGHWVDCDALTGHLLGTTRGAVYVDIGANIGACVMQVLHTTNAHVVAFEPTPRNLFHLTSTLLNLPQHMKDRVTLFPVGLGDETTVSTVLTHPANAGNTQLRRSKDEKGVDGAKRETHSIPVERMDDLLGPGLSVDLIKMDVQGFECFVVSGMKRLLDRTQKVVFEVEKKLFERFVESDACSGGRLVQALQLSNFDVTSGRGKLVEDLTKKRGDALKAVDFAKQDMLATKRSSPRGA